IMRYEPTDDEWAAIRPMLPNKPRGVPRVNDRRVLNGIFWVLRSSDPSGLGIPTHAIADLDGFGHDDSVQCLAMGIAAGFRVLGAMMRQKRALSSIDSSLS